MWETLELFLTSPWFIIATALVIIVAMSLHHYRQLELIKSGLIKKQAARGWRVDYERLRSGLWLAALGGVIAYTLHSDAIGGWAAFWLLVALLGVGQIIASLIGRDRWLWRKKNRRHWQD